MKEKLKHSVDYFRLKPLKPAKISEISEATASASIPSEEKINFHIGNPIQDDELVNLYFNTAITQKSSLENSDILFSDLENDEEEIGRLQLVFNSIKNSSPYMPRGGFNSKSPIRLIEQFKDWLENNQADPLEYSIGGSDGEREICLMSGGQHESLRVLLLSLSKYLVHLPVTIFYKGLSIPKYLQTYSGLRFENLNKKNILTELKDHFENESANPAFLFLGKVPTEGTRRKLRNYSVRSPLYIVEFNDAPNHLSLAREAKMQNKVLRILSPRIFSDFYKNSSISFAAGNSGFIKVLETIHFQIKGTPAAAEVELLSYLIDNPGAIERNDKEPELNITDPTSESGFVESVINKFSVSIEEKGARLSQKLNQLSSKTSESIKNLPDILTKRFNYDSPFSGLESGKLIKKLITGFDSDELHTSISESFKSGFVQQNSEYEFDDTLVVSGSARTVLSLIGFHCGISEVLSPDFSWTYEHCFPSVKVLPLDKNLQLDDNIIIEWIKKKNIDDTNWKNYGAVILNNPHNASGKVFDSKILSGLIKWLLANDIYVIDDLSYKNVAPSTAHVNIPTIRALALDLVKNGYLSSHNLNKLITVQSLSKTDCYAGARVALVNIPEIALRKKLSNIVEQISPNSFALLIAYLFYRNDPAKVNYFWNLRNKKFAERMDAIEEAVSSLPNDRNLFNIKISRPDGSMYPAMIIEKLPAGLSLDWISSGLAKEGIGLVPLSTFARTAEGYNLARKTFRLTLGGKDTPEKLSRKTRRVLIDLNYMISEEDANYNRKSPAYINKKRRVSFLYPNPNILWEDISSQLELYFEQNLERSIRKYFVNGTGDSYIEKFINVHWPFRKNILKNKLTEGISLANQLLNSIAADKGQTLLTKLEKEFFKDDLTEKQERFRYRLFDRTVHPTQMYSLKVDFKISKLVNNVIAGKSFSASEVKELAKEIIEEFLGNNVAIKSVEEADELLLDIQSLIEAENYLSLFTENELQTFLSFWGDWDGSTRPSGQGHRLVAAALVENVTKLCQLYQLLKKHQPEIQINEQLASEIENLSSTNTKFWSLLNSITELTNQLEKRFKTLLPESTNPGLLRKLGIKLHLRKDPIKSLFEHNDRLERKMFELRTERTERLEYYFNLNKRLRKTFHTLLPEIHESIKIPEVGVQFGLYKNLLSRFVLTPRIHQKVITARDQFSIDTTVHNIMEINEIADKYGNPGMILGLQISMSTTPEALISADRKFIAKADELKQTHPEAKLPNIWVIPLFEEIQHVQNVHEYLNKVWDYALQSRKVNETTEDRFTNIICELFVAGSDLSQQVGQSASAELYKQAKYDIIKWLAERGLVQKVRMKLGSGEPMQRQGGYYSEFSGQKAFIASGPNTKILKTNLKDSTVKSTAYATSPLMGVHSSGDLRTFQSNISERMRLLSLKERAELLFQIKELQHVHRRNLIRSTEPLTDTRLKYKKKGLQDLERITLGKKDELFAQFIELTKENFEQILYGAEDDVAGIHVVSYFISRTTPTLRDRPTVRPTKDTSSDHGQKILERISETIPLRKHGTLLRAIGHNRAQSSVLGYNQLTTGLFRAMKLFCDELSHGNNPHQILADRILPYLPVYEILESLRLYHEPGLDYILELQRAFPAGNSALIKLREDIDSFNPFIGLLQRELLRRHGLSTSEFFDNFKFNKNLLPTLRPDLAVLLQNDLFNTEFDDLELKIEVDNPQWRSEVVNILEKPKEIRIWRKEVWQLLLAPIYEQVDGFNQLARALYRLSQNSNGSEFKMPSSANSKTTTGFSSLKHGILDDTMQQFLNAAVQYLSNLPKDSAQIPMDIIRALKDVEKILLVEKQALSISDQEKLNFFLLQIARISGENG